MGTLSFQRYIKTWLANIMDSGGKMAFTKRILDVTIHEKKLLILRIANH